MLLTVDLERLEIQPGDTLLDAGCGEGRHCFGALERGARVVGLDLDHESLRLASRALGTPILDPLLDQLNVRFRHASRVIKNPMPFHRQPRWHHTFLGDQRNHIGPALHVLKAL